MVAKTASFALPAAVFLIRSASCSLSASLVSVIVFPVSLCCSANCLNSAPVSFPAFFNLSSLSFSLLNNRFKSLTSPFVRLILSVSKIPSSLKSLVRSFAKLSVAARSEKDRSELIPPFAVFSNAAPSSVCMTPSSLAFLLFDASSLFIFPPFTRSANLINPSITSFTKSATFCNPGAKAPPILSPKPCIAASASPCVNGRTKLTSMFLPASNVPSVKAASDNLLMSLKAFCNP